jgi:hypothetical protein
MMADIEVKDLTLMTADITALDVIPITDVSTGETLKITTQTLLNATSLLPIKGRDGGDIGGYLMDGVNDYVTVPDDANLDVGTSDFSIEIFIYFNKIVDSQVIRKWDTATGFLLQLMNIVIKMQEVWDGLEAQEINYLAQQVAHQFA